MRKIYILLFLLIFPASSLFSQGSKATLSDPELRTKLEQVKANFDNLYTTFKTAEQPNAEVNFDDSYYTSITFYNITGTTSVTDFDSDISFRIASSDYTKATKEDFEKIFAELSTNLKAVFNDLDVRESSTDKETKLTLFEKGKNTELAVRDPGSPKYYISLTLREEDAKKRKSYAIHLYFTGKK